MLFYKATECNLASKFKLIKKLNNVKNNVQLEKQNGYYTKYFAANLLDFNSILILLTEVKPDDLRKFFVKQGFIFILKMQNALTFSSY